jgi:dipeptidyl aminopeptidase/acylaminoacyl peptidase
MATGNERTSGVDGDRLRSAIEALARIGRCSGASLSPDGQRVAFISDLSGVPQVWIIPTGGGWPEKVTAFDDPVMDVVWSPVGAWLALSVAPGGGMNTQIYTVRPDGSELRLLTAGGRETNWLGPWSHDGRFLGISSNQDDPESMDCYLLDVETGERRRIARNQGVGRIMDLSRDGTWATVQRVVNRSDANVVLVNLATGSEILLTPHEGPGTFEGGTFSPDGRTIYLGSNQDRDLVAFARIDLDEAGTPGPIEVLAARDDAELDGFETTDDARVAALIWNVGGRNELELMELSSGRHMSVTQLPHEVALVHPFSRDGEHLPLSISGSAAPWDLWMLAVQTGQLSQLTRSPHPGVDLTDLVQPELVRFLAHDGVPLTAWLYRPRASGAPGPAVLSFHGGPEAQERPRFSYEYQVLLAQGIAVLAPNVRGSAGFGKAFVNLDNGELRFDAVRDIKACLEYVVSAGVAERGHIGIMGGSYGGYMTMAGLTEYPDDFAAGSNLFGIVNYETFFQQTEPWMAAISKVEYGDPDTEVDLLRRLSPIHRIDRVRAPTLVLHGANDTNVPVVEAEQTVRSLEQRGVPVKYVLFPDEGHGFQKMENRITAAVEIAAWFATYLQE